MSHTDNHRFWYFEVSRYFGNARCECGQMLLGAINEETGVRDSFQYAHLLHVEAMTSSRSCALTVSQTRKPERDSTPGPWRISRDGAIIADIAYATSEDRDTGHATPNDSREREREYYDGGLLIAGSVKPHNRSLIAAAPDLLDALLSFENDDGFVPPAIWEQRNAAIAKAAGYEHGTIALDERTLSRLKTNLASYRAKKEK